jgi:hypothetical protein
MDDEKVREKVHIYFFIFYPLATPRACVWIFRQQPRSVKKEKDSLVDSLSSISVTTHSVLFLPLLSLEAVLADVIAENKSKKTRPLMQPHRKYQHLNVYECLLLSDAALGHDSLNCYQDLIWISLPVSTTCLLSVKQDIPDS